MPAVQLITIHLENLRFFGYHGIHEHEKRNGNDFEINLSISLQQTHEPITKIEQTIDYAALHELIKTEMQHRRELLETFLEELSLIIKTRFPQTESLSVSIYKLTAPIPELNGRVGVQLHKSW